MARRGRGRSRGQDPAAANRTARVGELIRRIVAQEMELLDDDRLSMVSITSVDVDRDLHRAVVWFTTLAGDDDPEVVEALDEHRPQLRRSVATQTRLRRAPELDFRSDATLRSAERIEQLLRETADSPPVPDPDPDAYRQDRTASDEDDEA